MIAIVFALTIPAAGALADDVGGDSVIQIQPQAAVVEEPVTAPPPAYVELESRAIAAGIGARVGNASPILQAAAAKASRTTMTGNLTDCDFFANTSMSMQAG